MHLTNWGYIGWTVPGLRRTRRPAGYIPGWDGARRGYAGSISINAGDTGIWFLQGFLQKIITSFLKGTATGTALDGYYGGWMPGHREWGAAA